MENKLQELTNKLYQEGLAKGKEEADILLEKAKEEALAIVQEARKEATWIVDRAEQAAETQRAGRE